jgi:hypothetical protein
MQDDGSGCVSAFESHVLRDAFRASVAELKLPETRWVEHATTLMQQLTGDAEVDAGLVEWIIRK